MSANKSTKNAHDEITKRLLSSLPSGYTYQQVKLPNEAFDTPVDDKWLRLSIIDLVTENTQAGSNPWQRTEALLVLDIFYPVNSFRRTGYSWPSTDPRPDLTDAEALKALFSNQRFNGVNCEEGNTEVIGQDSNTWFQTQVNINFYYEGC